ncbi:MAG: hypothetical protein IKG96_04135 [Bacteroidaceae bacterium]|nr:hypothetical protein [Bacteroidaceae bacterium]MBR3442829.1 hypothetical protein [Bacteroidaceae bacterium]
MANFGQDPELRREELIRVIEHSLQTLTAAELEALYYDMLTKDYIRP